MKKKLISLIGLTLCLAVAGLVVGFTLNGGSGTPAQEPAGQVEEPSCNRHPIRSDEGIDPSVCNAVHNINACTQEELEEMGMYPMARSIAVGENHGGVKVAGKPEPLFMDSEPQYEVQSYEEAVKQDCDLAGGTFWASSDGKVGCDIVNELEDSGEELVSSSQPPTIEPLPATVTQ